MQVQKQFREFTNNTRFIVTANLNSRVIKVSLTHDARQGSRIVQNANVVFDTFGLFGFGLGFYGPGIYLVALKARHGWSIAELSSIITTYYVLGASFLFCGVGSLFELYGARKVLIVGIVAMSMGLVLLTWVARLWQVYAAFALMSVGWATMSGAAINIIVAPWF